MQEEKNFFQPLPDSSLEDLKKRIANLENQLKASPSGEQKEKEVVVKQEIKEYLFELQQTPSFAPPVSARDEADEISEMETSAQVGALISLTFEKGLSRALALARRLKNPAILDEFHDSLVDYYYDQLLKSKIINP